MLDCEADGGRGVRIVDKLSKGWRAEDLGERGKSVRVELRTSP